MGPYGTPLVPFTAGWQVGPLGWRSQRRRPAVYKAMSSIGTTGVTVTVRLVSDTSPALGNSNSKVVKQVGQRIPESSGKHSLSLHAHLNLVFKMSNVK